MNLIGKKSSRCAWRILLPAILFLSYLTVSSMLHAQSLMADVDRAVEKADGILGGYTHEVHSLFIQDRLTLSFWIVIPEIDTRPSESELPANCEIAIRKALDLSRTLMEEMPEIRIIFDSINPMIADSNYATWYMDFIPVKLLPSDFEIFTRFHDMDIAYIRRSVPVEKTLPELDAAIQKVCSYLDKELPVSHPSGYLIIEEAKPYVQLYFVKHQAVKTLAELIPIIRQSCLFLAPLVPDIDRIEFFCLTPNRRLQAYSTVSCSGLIIAGKSDNLIAHTNFYPVTDSGKDR